MSNENKALAPVQAGVVQAQPAQAISFYDKIADPVQAIVTFGKFISQSGLCGKMNEQQGNVIAWHCITKKIDPIDFTREYHVLSDGKLSRRADAMLSEFMRRGGKVKWISDLNDDKEAKAEFSDRDGNKYSWSFAIEDAKGYMQGHNGVKDNWKNSAPDMLRARLISKAVRALDPEVNQGVYTPEELRDAAPERPEISPTGLFDRSDAAGAPQTAPKSTPAETTAEVVDTKQPTAQTATAPKSEAAQPAPTKPQDPAGKKDLTPVEMFAVIKSKFEAFGNPSAVDGILRAKKWIEPAECLMDLDVVHTKLVYDSIDKIIAALPGWIKQQEARTKLAANGGAK